MSGEATEPSPSLDVPSVEETLPLQEPVLAIRPPKSVIWRDLG